MKKFGSYRILKEHKTIIEYHAGDISPTEFLNSRKIISSDKEYNPGFDVILNYRDTNLFFEPEDIDNFVNHFKKYDPIIGQRKSAFITKKPNQVVFTTLFSDGTEDIPVNIGTFCTTKAVFNWIGNTNFNVKYLNDIFKELKNSPNTLYSMEIINKKVR